MPRRACVAPLLAALFVVASSIAACDVNRTEVVAGTPFIAATITLRPPAGEVPDKAATDEAVAVLVSRLDSLDIDSYSITAGDEIVVAIEEPADVFLVQRAVQTSGVIDFVPLPEGVTVPEVGTNVQGLEPLWEGDQVESATASDGADGVRTVSVRFTDAAGGAMAAWSADNIGQYLLVVLDGRVVAAPDVLGPLGRDLDLVLIEADLPIPLEVFAAILKSGPLPEAWRQP